MRPWTRFLPASVRRWLCRRTGFHRPIRAQHPGICSGCGHFTQVGELVRWDGTGYRGECCT